MNYLLFPFLAVIAIDANGAVIVDSLRAQYTSDNVYRRAAQAFHTTSQTWIITDVDIVGIGTSSDISISIFSNNGLPLSRIATLYRGSAEDAGFGTDITNKTPTNFTFSPVTLAPRTYYWIVVENLKFYSGQTNLKWGSTFSDDIYGDGYSPAAVLSSSENTWGSYQSHSYVMRITAVPEPNHVMMLGFGVLIAMRRSRAKRQSEQAGLIVGPLGDKLLPVAPGAFRESG